MNDRAPDQYPDKEPAAVPEPRFVRWVHLSTVAIMVLVDILDGLGHLALTLRSRLSRFGERRLRRYVERQADIQRRAREQHDKEPERT